MARNQNVPLSPNKIAADIDVYAAVKSIAGYAPSNPAYALTALEAAHAELHKAQQAQVQTEAAAAAARDAAVAKQWEFHNLMLGVKNQVVAQFGEDSSEVQAVGLKRSSERRMRQRTVAPSTAK